MVTTAYARPTYDRNPRGLLGICNTRSTDNTACDLAWGGDDVVPDLDFWGLIRLQQPGT